MTLMLALNASLLSPSCFIDSTVRGLALIAGYECPAGFYCPNSTATVPWSIPQMCPPTVKCQLDRLSSTACEPQGVYEPIACVSGNYCPDSKQMLPCPDGNFCPTGSKQPRPCDWLSYCPQGSGYRISYGGIIITMIIDLILVVLHFILEFRRRRLLLTKVHDRPEQYAAASVKEITKHSSSTALDIDMSATDSRYGSDPDLLRGYKKAFNISDSGDIKGNLSVELKFNNLGLDLPDGRTVLQGVGGTIRPGKLTCIMGPSGSGKTTFMNVLMGKVARSRGEILINNQPQELHTIKKVIGYVPQEDTMLREMTVRETIRYSAAVRVPNDWTRREVDNFVDAVINTLGLTHVKHQIIGDEITRGISGGQRKRVNIGMELCSAPLLLFCDEPTSGLDSTASLKVASTLKSITALGISVITVLHQPRYEIFQQFDDIILIAPGGRIAYIGEQVNVVNYFEKKLGYKFDTMSNPADILMDILSDKAVNTKQKLRAEILPDLWIQSSAKESKYAHHTSTLNLSGATTRKSVSWIYQTWLAHNRSLVQQYRKFSSILIELGVSALAGALMGISVMGTDGEMFRGIYVEPFTLISPAPIGWIIPLLGLLTAMSVGLAGGPAAVKTFGEERTVYWREAAAGHRRFAYYLGKTVSTFYRILLTSLHFTAIFYALAKPIIAFNKMYGIVFLLFFNVYGLASIVSMVVRREDAPLLAVISCLFAAVLCGFGPTLTNVKSWGILWLWEASYAKHASEALYKEESSAYRGIYNLEETAKIYGYALGDSLMNFFWMLVIGIVLRVITFVLMISLNHQKQR